MLLQLLDANLKRSVFWALLQFKIENRFIENAYITHYTKPNSKLYAKNVNCFLKENYFGIWLMVNHRLCIIYYNL